MSTRGTFVSAAAGRRSRSRRVRLPGLRGPGPRGRRAGREGQPRPKPTHFPARAKRVVFLCMNGGPSHVDLFDYKPELNRRSGESSPVGGGKLLGSPFKFAQHGKAGLWVSEVFPELAKHADDLCVVHSMRTDLPNHSQAFLQMHTGSFQFVRPSVGAWTLYGLGSENANSAPASSR
ncbi:MAG: DUF1501 domain-containing protein [Gemmataceae bacterium]